MKKLLGAIALAVVLLASLPLHSASASLGACGKDPVITLTDGTVVQLDAHIGDDGSDLSAVNFTLKWPYGNPVTNISWAGDAGGTESLTQLHWLKPNQYDGWVSVNSGASPISVTLYMTVTLPSGGGTYSNSVTGNSGGSNGATLTTDVTT